MNDWRHCPCCEEQTEWIVGDGDEIRCYACGVSEEYAAKIEG